MTDYLAGLSLSQEPEVVDSAMYVPPSTGNGFIVKKGKYLAKQIDGEYGPDKILAVEFGETRNGYLSATLAFEIVEPNGKHDGRKLRFIRVNTAPYARAKDEARRKMNSALDYLVAMGVDPKTLTSNDAYAEALVSGIGKFVKINVDGDAYCRDCDQSFYWSQFPVGADGTNETEMSCPNHAADAAPVLKIRNKIARFEPAAR